MPDLEYIGEQGDRSGLRVQKPVVESHGFQNSKGMSTVTLVLKRAIVIAMMVGTIGSLWAQSPPQRWATKYTFEQAVRYIGDVSGRFYDAFVDRQKEGVFVIEPDYYKDLSGRLNEIQQRLKDFTGDEPIGPTDLSEMNRFALQSALACDRCSGDVPSAGRAKFVETKAQLRNLLVARCGVVQALLSRPGPGGKIGRNVAFSIELHLTYLRLISIAFVGLG